MIILGIETSCDETSVALVKKEHNAFRLLSQTTATSLSLHATTGGIIPEIAAREQLSYILPVLRETMKKGLEYNIDTAQSAPPIDRIAVTYGPGLIGSLLVGVETARVLSYIWNSQVIPVNHLFGHIYANWLELSSIDAIEFPALALVVSGGHTDLVLMQNHRDIKVIGGTRDDAAGEAFDKVGRLLGLPYPAGPIIEEKAKRGDSKAFHFPRPMLDSGDYDFSFSGLKTAVLREVKATTQLTDETINNLCASMQQAVIDVLINKTLRAAKEFDVKSILLSGGVAANQTLVERFKQETKDQRLTTKLFVPTKSFCTDNAAMIAAAAFFRDQEVPWPEITVNPELYFS